MKYCYDSNITNVNDYYEVRSCLYTQGLGFKLRTEGGSGSNFGIFGPARGGFNGRSRTIGTPQGRPRRRPGVARF